MQNDTVLTFMDTFLKSWDFNRINPEIRTSKKSLLIYK